MVAVLGAESLAVGVLPCSVEVLRVLLSESFLIHQEGLERIRLDDVFVRSGLVGEARRHPLTGDLACNSNS